MYNLELFDNENVVKIFANILFKQNDEEKNTTIILTNKRLLFLDYINDYREVLTKVRGIDYIKYKEVYYQINLIDIKNILKNKIVLKSDIIFEFNDNELLKLIKKNVILIK